MGGLLRGAGWGWGGGVQLFGLCVAGCWRGQPDPEPCQVKRPMTVDEKELPLEK